MPLAESRAPLYRVGVGRVRYVTNWIVTGAATVLFGSLGALAAIVDSSGRGAYACGRYWGRLVLSGSGIRVSVSGVERLDPAATYILVSNHHSLLDIPAVLGYLPVRTRMLAKASLFRIPFMGWYLSRAGYVPVHREDRRRARASVGVAAGRTGKGSSMFLFAEGTRFPEGQPGPFKRGAAHLALTTGLSVVPIGLINSGRLLPRGGWRADPGVIEIRVGEPISVESAEQASIDAAGLTRRIRREVLTLAGIAND